jgi:ABC-2 type transport system ATP-binding protein
MYDLPNDKIKKRVDELVSLFDLESFIDQPVRKLSLGQRMRAEVAASLIHSPQIILLDEPTIGLDVVAKKALRDLLLTVNKEEKTTIFLTSHDVGDIETLCERTIVINHGQIVEDLPTRELSKSFAFEKRIDLIPRERFESFPALAHGIRYAEQTPDKVTVVVDINTIGVQNALQSLLSVFDVEDVDVYSADLEEVIRHMYERAATRT